MPVADPPLFPAQNLILEIQGDHLPDSVLINDEPFPLVRSENASRGHLLLDCFRSTAFHLIDVDGQLFCFGTTDAKLKLEGVMEMLAAIGREGLSWGQQLIFSDGNAIRDPRVDFAWLRSNARKILAACTEIAASPAQRSVQCGAIGRPSNGRIRITESMAYLRSDQANRLEPHANGSISLLGKRYFPRYAVVDRRKFSIDATCNRRATYVLQALRSIVEEQLANPAIPRRHLAWLRAIQGRAIGLLLMHPFCQLHFKSRSTSERRDANESRDPRYEVTFEAASSLTEQLGWEATQHVSQRFAYVGYADEIFQAFVAVLLAQAFQTCQVVPCLTRDLPSPSFRSAAWDLYYDTTPPSDSYRSWRDESDRPARVTPDYCLINRENRRGVLGDAKYRSNGDGARLPASSLNECQVYMQHFGLKNFVVFHPGAERAIHEVTGGGNTILEVSVTPHPGVTDWFAASVRPRIEALLEPLPA